MKLIRDIEGNVKSARQHRKEVNRKSEETAHKLWVRRIANLMGGKRCSSGEAFKLLKTQVEQEILECPAQRRAQYKAAWLAFTRKVEQAKKH